MKSHFIKMLFAFCLVTNLFILYTQMISCSKVVKKYYKILEMKYILLWTSDKSIPFIDMGRGQEGFVKRNCSFVNCFITSNRTILKNVSDFDVIMFSGPDISDLSNVNVNVNLPEIRSSHQKYVFASIESAQYYPVDSSFDGVFNWTWTYRLHSDVRWGYIVVKDLKNNVIGPRTNMNWLKLEEMDPVTEEIKVKLKKKRKIAAWIVSNCFSISKRESFYEKLNNILRKKYKQSIDMYGKCGLHVCKEQEVCNKKISDDYYFYLSFENSFSEDYVTEKLLLALQNNAVPIVYGGANYTRFMPDGIYLNALELGADKLAAKMVELMNDFEKYANYFRWQNHYRYGRTTDSSDTNEYCKMCALINDEDAVRKKSVYLNFTDWWNSTTTDMDLLSL